MIQHHVCVFSFCTNLYLNVLCLFCVYVSRYMSIAVVNSDMGTVVVALACSDGAIRSVCFHQGPLEISVF